jgi:hypothetical protein
VAKFDFDIFNDGCCNTDFVVNRKMFSKEEALKLFEAEVGYCDDVEIPTIDVVWPRYCRYTVKAPIELDLDGGCYVFCKPGDRGAFPVWQIEIKKIKDC